MCMCSNSVEEVGSGLSIDLLPTPLRFSPASLSSQSGTGAHAMIIEPLSSNRRLNFKQ